MFFSEIINQQTVKEKLLISVHQNQVSHAQLFLGPEGNGSLALALAYAQYINCENRLENDSCGKCSSCIKSQKLIHPDIHYSFPSFRLKEKLPLSKEYMVEWREAVLSNPYLSLSDWFNLVADENKQGTISVEECHQILYDLSMKTFESEYKITIIWRPEFFTQGGKIANTLLKILEEPPDHTLLVLVAENRDQLLPTILSRCQITSIPRLSDDDLMEILINKHELPREAAVKIVRQSEGNYREARRLVNSEEDDQFEFLKRWMQLLISGKPEGPSELVKWVDEASRLGREKQKSFFRYSLEFFRECVIVQQAGEQHSTLLEEEKKMAAWFTERMSEEDWQQLQKWLEDAHYHIERNAHAKILLMNLSLQLHKLIINKKLTLAID